MQDLGERLKNNSSGSRDRVSLGRDHGPAGLKDSQRRITGGLNSLPPMQNVIYANTPGDERKRRRENEHGSIPNQNLNTEVLLLECPEDDRCATLFLSAGSGGGAGRPQ